jgi:hypothetical protein
MEDFDKDDWPVESVNLSDADEEFLSDESSQSGLVGESRESLNELSSLQRGRARVELTRQHFQKYSTLSEITESLYRLDRQIIWIDKLLYYSQPPAAGRIRISWERTRGFEDRYQPVWVQWVSKKSPSGKTLWRYKYLSLPKNSVKSIGGFQVHREEVLSIIDLGQILFRHRRDLINYLADLDRAWTQKRRRIASEDRERAESLREIIARINGKGVVSISEGDIAD